MSENNRDYKAEYGHQPAWDLQRRKQEEHGEAVNERREQKRHEKRRA